MMKQKQLIKKLKLKIKQNNPYDENAIAKYRTNKIILLCFVPRTKSIFVDLATYSWLAI